MAIKKQYLKSKPLCKVTFEIPAAYAKDVAVAGDWNNWETTAYLKKLKNGTFKGAFNLPVAERYEFRYVIDGKWQNEPAADGYAYNEYAGTDNAVLEL